MSKSIQTHNNWALLLKLSHWVQIDWSRTSSISPSIWCKTCHWHIFWRQRNTTGSNPRIFLHLVLSLFSSIDNLCPTNSKSTFHHGQNTACNPSASCYFCTPDISLSHQYYRFHYSSALADWSIKPNMLCTMMHRHFLLHLLAKFVCYLFKVANKIQT